MNAKAKLSLLTIGALVTGVVLVVLSIVLGGSIWWFLDFKSALITVGGTLCAIVMSFPAKQLKAAIKAMKLAFTDDSINVNGDIDQLINMANIARRDGLLALESSVDEMDNHFIRKGIMLVVDGSNSELVKTVMETEINFISARHEEAIQVFRQGASFAPSFGMIGTLIGLIQMLIMMDDPGSIGKAMSVALVTTFYGTMMANLFFTPIAAQLQAKSDKEELRNQMVLEGILSIQDGENPRIIRDKLEAFIAAADIVAPNQAAAEGNEVEG